MKTPTERELERLAVEALGEGATVDVHVHSAHAWDSTSVIARVTVNHPEAVIALAAALRALAEVRR